MPSMPPPPCWCPPPAASFFSGISEIMASVVSIRPAIDAAFCSAVRVTFVGSMTPAVNQVLVDARSGVVAEVGAPSTRGSCR